MMILEYKENESFLFNGSETKKILEINKDDILKTLKYIYENDNIEIGNYDEKMIKNEAERIVYENLYKKFKDFNEKKLVLHSEINALFEEIETKYKL